MHLEKNTSFKAISTASKPFSFSLHPAHSAMASAANKILNKYFIINHLHNTLYSYKLPPYSKPRCEQRGLDIRIGCCSA